MILIIIRSVLLIGYSDTRELFVLRGVAIIIGLIGMGSFESTTIKFGMDQMLGGFLRPVKYIH